jgi:hypothetical protein
MVYHWKNGLKRVTTASSNLANHHGRTKVRCWPKIAPDIDATGVRYGHVTAPGQLNLGVYFLQRRH